MKKEVLDRFFKNECTDKEAHEVLIWVNSEEGQASLGKSFDDFEWGDMADNGISSDKMLSNIHRIIGEQRLMNEMDRPADAMLNRPGGRRRMRFINVAATLLLLVAASFITYFITSNGIEMGFQEVEWVTQVAPLGKKSTLYLGDGTMVKLNAGSKMIYPREFSDDSREVTLIGEAYFDVERDEQRPFLINSGEVDVRVLGTSFIVKSYAEDDLITVAVESGKVSVTGKLNKAEVTLEKGDLAFYKPSTKKFDTREVKNSSLYFGWINQNIVFEDNNIDEIFNVLARWYGIEFVVQKELDLDKKFTAIYKKPTLKVILESLSVAYNFNYEVKNKQVIIN